jgi:hypothetical protein
MNLLPIPVPQTNEPQPDELYHHTNLSNAFQLSPATFPESSLQHWKNTNIASDGDYFNINNLSDDFKVHWLILCQRFEKIQQTPNKSCW